MPRSGRSRERGRAGSSFFQMIVPERGERSPVEEDAARVALAHDADAGEWNAFEGGRDLAVRGEEKLVVLAAVEGVVDGRAREAGRGSDVGGHSGGGAEAAKVERESVAEVHGGSGAIAQEAPERESR